MPDGSSPARDFLQESADVREKGKDRPDATAQAKLMVLFDQMAMHGKVSYKRFSREVGKIYAFKCEVRNIQIRVACFQDGNKWILTHGFKKQGAQSGLGKWPKSEIERAEFIMNTYFLLGE